MISDSEHLFIYLLSISMSSLASVYSDPLPIFNEVICILANELYGSLMYFGY